MIKTISNKEYINKELDWGPLSKTSANFTTHRLRAYGLYEMRSHKTLFYILFLLIVFVAGLVLLWFISFGDPVYRRGAAPFKGDDIGGDILAYFLGFAFTSVGIFSALFDKKVVIDRLNNSLSTGENNLYKEAISWPLSDITSVQLLSKTCRDSDGDDYLAFELNVVFRNKQRVNLMTHGGQTAISKDAERVASFLSKPLFSNL